MNKSQKSFAYKMQNKKMQSNRKMCGIPQINCFIILEQPFVCLGKSTATHAFYSDYLLKCGIQKDVDIEVATAEQILPIVKSGVGIDFIAEFLAAEVLKSGEIKEIKLKNSPPSRTIYLAEDKRRSLSVAARTFIIFIILT